MHHLLIAGGVAAVILLEWAWRAGKRRRRLALLPDPDVPLWQQVSLSGNYKVVAYAHDNETRRLEILRQDDALGAEDTWVRVAGPSFAHRSSSERLARRLLRRASGDLTAGPDFACREPTEPERAVQEYEGFVAEVRQGGGYGMCLAEYVNDLACRAWLERRRGDPAVARMWTRVEAADVELKAILLPTKRCIHGEAPESHFWLWGYPGSSPELEADLQNMSML